MCLTFIYSIGFYVDITLSANFIGLSKLFKCSPKLDRERCCSGIVNKLLGEVSSYLYIMVLYSDKTERKQIFSLEVPCPAVTPVAYFSMSV